MEIADMLEPPCASPDCPLRAVLDPSETQRLEAEFVAKIEADMHGYNRFYHALHGIQGTQENA